MVICILTPPHLCGATIVVIVGVYLIFIATNNLTANVSSICQNDGCLCKNKATLKVEFEENNYDRNNM
jgi:hypothetical protein